MITGNLFINKGFNSLRAVFFVLGSVERVTSKRSKSKILKNNGILIFSRLSKTSFMLSCLYLCFN